MYDKTAIHIPATLTVCFCRVVYRLSGDRKAKHSFSHTDGIYSAERFQTKDNLYKGMHNVERLIQQTFIHIPMGQRKSLKITKSKMQCEFMHFAYLQQMHFTRIILSFLQSNTCMFNLWLFCR